MGRIVPMVGSDLDGTLRGLLDDLRRAVYDTRHPWRAPVLATAGADGAHARIVIMRQFEVQPTAFQFYTDGHCQGGATRRGASRGVGLVGPGGASAIARAGHGGATGTGFSGVEAMFC